MVVAGADGGMITFYDVEMRSSGVIWSGESWWCSMESLFCISGI